MAGPIAFSILAFAALANAIPKQVPFAGIQQPTNKVVIAQMFEWDWVSVAAECTNALGPAGYGFVQVSPAQEHIKGSQWWTDYQPVSYILKSKRGDESQYKAMIDTCHAAGVKVIADTLWNHMTSGDSGVGVAGSNFTYYDYPGIYNYSNFHHCGLEKDDNIVNYDNAVEVWTCQLGGLADLATDTEYVREQLANYANHLLSLGVDGLRLDASKHINPSDIANISSRFNTKPYITQEVIWGAGEAVTPDMYTANGDVQEFRYTATFRYAFLNGGIASLKNLDDFGWIAGSNTNVFVSNHDTERNLNSLNAYSPSNTYTLATVFSLAHPYGTPTVLSSYSNFYNRDVGGPNNGTGICGDTDHVAWWFCQHRWPAIAGMVGFRNNVGNAALVGWVSPSSQQIAFARGSLGFVAINNIDTAWTSTFATGLPAGSYCNVIEGPYQWGTCSGTVFVIGNDGTLSVTVGPRQAIAVHTGAKGNTAVFPTAQLVPVLFSEKASTTLGENIFVVGNVPQLGNWNTSHAIPLDAINYPVWGATVYLPPVKAFEYKFIRVEANGSIVWESDPNRQDTTPASGVQLIATSWR